MSIFNESYITEFLGIGKKKKIKNIKRTKRLITESELNSAVSKTKNIVKSNKYIKQYESDLKIPYDSYEEYKNGHDNYIQILCFDIDDWSLNEELYDKVSENIENTIASKIDGISISDDLELETDWNGHRLDARLKFKNSKYWDN